MTTELEQKIAEQAAVIENLLEDLLFISEIPIQEHYRVASVARQALAIPTDSKQILAEWLDKVLGEPVGYVDNFGNVITKATKDFSKNIMTNSFADPLFKKPEIK